MFQLDMAAAFPAVSRLHGRGFELQVVAGRASDLNSGFQTFRLNASQGGHFTQGSRLRAFPERDVVAAFSAVGGLRKLRLQLEVTALRTLYFDSSFGSHLELLNMKR
jgi:hypothetical protein